MGYFDDDDMFNELSAKDKKTQQSLGEVGQFVVGVYKEMDKLGKKAPRDTVTDLALKRVNLAIADAMELLPDNRYIADIETFVAAGENPEFQDVVLVLREILQQLRRHPLLPQSIVVDIDKS